MEQTPLKGLLYVSLVTFLTISLLVIPLHSYILKLQAANPAAFDLEIYRIILLSTAPFLELWIWWVLMKKFVWKFK